jgi:hypothetical protein
MGGWWFYYKPLCSPAFSKIYRYRISDIRKPAVIEKTGFYAQSQNRSPEIAKKWLVLLVTKVKP